MLDWFLQGNWNDWKYIITVPFCLLVGFCLGWKHHGDKLKKPTLYQFGESSTETEGDAFQQEEK